MSMFCAVRVAELVGCFWDASAPVLDVLGGLLVHRSSRLYCSVALLHQQRCSGRGFEVVAVLQAGVWQRIDPLGRLGINRARWLRLVTQVQSPRAIASTAMQLF